MRTSARGGSQSYGEGEQKKVTEREKMMISRVRKAYTYQISDGNRKRRNCPAREHREWS